MSKAVPSFASRLLAWHALHGRSHLPWQQPRTPYRVWLSEIMLQQTQVSAVIPYFERFVARFPEVTTLAAAEPDELMRYWAVLGYYARARNLHAAAKQVVAEHGGEFPSAVADLIQLKGVGRSTAAAISAQAFGLPAAILDGNVKRVLCRWAGIEGHPATAVVNKQLWALAETLLPNIQAADYVQAQMDLGATLCTARKPACTRCPLVADCVAHLSGRSTELPSRKPRKARLRREAWLIIASDAQGRVLLEQRPGFGIWGGLWSPPVIAFDEDREALLRSRHAIGLRNAVRGTAIEHSFTHFDLCLHPVLAEAEPMHTAVTEPAASAWHQPAQIARGILALPAPVARYFERSVLTDDLTQPSL